MFFIQVLQVDFLADFQFTLVYTGLLFLPPDEILIEFLSQQGLLGATTSKLVDQLIVELVQHGFCEVSGS